jgi:hypothetical protein
MSESRPRGAVTRHAWTSVLIALLLASPAHAQGTSQSAEIAQLRSELQRALVRIEMLERVILNGAPPAAATPPAARGLMTPSTVEGPRPTRSSRSAPAPASSGYIRGPKGGCYTYTASGRKRYVDHSFCGG